MGNTNQLIENSIKRAKEREAIKSSLQEIHKELAANGRIPAPPSAVKRFYLYPRIYRIAAAILFLLVVLAGLQWYTLKPGKALYASHIEILSTELVEGIKGNETNLTWKESYRHKLYNRTINTLSKCLSNNTCDPFYGVYLGIAYLETQQTTKAVQSFEKALDFPHYIARENIIRYYLALALLKQGKYKKAKNELKTIIDSGKENIYLEKAKLLYSEL